MTRRSGQNPSVRVGKRADGTKYYFFQFWVDTLEGRERKTEVLGIVGQMTKSEAERKRAQILLESKVNSSEYRIPSAATFADAVKHYREEFGPRFLRDSTFITADNNIRAHLETDWGNVPIDRITIDAVNDWAKKKRGEGLSWVYVKNILRTMQRVLSAFSKDRKPPFSQTALAIPERDKLEIRLRTRKAVSFSWQQANRIAVRIRRLDSLEKPVRERDAMAIILAAASGLRCSELLGLRMDDLDFRSGSVRVDEAVNQWTGRVDLCKNAAAYRAVVLADREGRKALRMLKRFIGVRLADPNALVFVSRNGTPLRESNLLSESLHPALKALGLPQAGMHAFRHGCNRRWELAGMIPAVLRQQMGHSGHSMTVRYTGEIPLQQVRAAFSVLNGNKIDVLENMENGAFV